jgi:hypothetical protein
MKEISPLEIRRFYSIGEIASFLENSMQWYQAVVNEYDKHLGELLRKPDGTKDEELEKKLSENMNRKNVNEEKKNKKGKKTEPESAGNWFDFRGIKFSAESKSAAETFFEAADLAKKNLERLKEVKTLVEELHKFGFPEGLVYSTYIVEGIPQTIYVEKESTTPPRYRFEISLSTDQPIQIEPHIEADS